MSTITLSITAVNNQFNSIDISDNTIGNNTAGSSGWFVSSATVSIYKRLTNTPVIVDVTSTYLASTSLPVTYSLTPSMVGDSNSDMFVDGEYELVFNIIRTKSANPDQVGTQTIYELEYGHTLNGIQTQIASLASTLLENCNCNDCEDTKTDLLTTMYMQLQSAIFGHACGKYTEAQAKLDTVLDFTTSSNCNTCC